MVFITSSDGRLYALDGLTGEPIWQFRVKGETLHWAESSPAVPSGFVFVGSAQGTPVRSGLPHWSVDLDPQAGASIDSSPRLEERLV